MDIVEKIIRENCWKFDKGYPDSQEDINYLKTLIEQQYSLFSDEELDNITVKVKKETGVDLDKVDKNTKDKIIDIVGDNELSDTEIERIKNLVGGFKYEKDFYNYVKSKGLAEKSQKAIFSKASEMGQLPEVVNYIKSSKPKFEQAGEGNILTLFSSSGISDDYLLWLYRYTIGAGDDVLGVGRMEEFIIFMFDNTINPSKGDAGLKDGTEIEVKGNEAKIWGTKDGILNSSGFKIGQKSIDREFGKLINNPYVGEFQKKGPKDPKTGKQKLLVKGDTALDSILIQNVQKAVDQGVSLDNIHQTILNVLFDFYNKDVSQKEIETYVTKDVITDQNKLNKAMFTAQLVAYSKAEGWKYLWLGIPNLGTYKVYEIKDIPKAVQSGEIKIHSKLGLGNVFRAKLN
jgi:hypothetical protein|tara:strand:+ start:431 stop:1636 length:1206 start_codon:yes stop_codon:yes gene_type:complete